MNLQIDVGNSFLKWRLIDAGNIMDRGREVTSSALSMEGVTEWAKIRAVSVSCVAADDVVDRLRSILSVNLPTVKPFFAISQFSLGVVVSAYRIPSQLGVDRWLAMVAGYSLCKESCFIVDCGSAITIDVIGGDGKHQGGYILPGVSLMKRSLSDGTGRVEFDKAESGGVKYGSTTSECVQAGINFTLMAIFERLRTRMETEKIKRLIVTGGDGLYVSSICDYAEYYPDLVLDGLTLANEVGDA